MKVRHIGPRNRTDRKPNRINTVRFCLVFYKNGSIFGFKKYDLRLFRFSYIRFDLNRTELLPNLRHACSLIKWGGAQVIFGQITYKLLLQCLKFYKHLRVHRAVHVGILVHIRATIVLKTPFLRVHVFCNIYLFIL